MKQLPQPPPSALALVRRPGLPPPDEPASAPDPARQLPMRGAGQDYARRQGIVTLAIRHHLNLAPRCADRVLLPAAGRPERFGPAADGPLIGRLPARIAGRSRWRGPGGGGPVEGDGSPPSFRSPPRGTARAGRRGGRGGRAR